MTSGGPSGLKIAPIRRRLAASVVDSLLVIPPVVVVGGGAVALYLRSRLGSDPDLAQPFTMPGWWNVPIWLGSTAAAVAARNWRTPGYRAVGLRRVDIETGGPVSVRSSLIQQAVLIASSQLRRQLLRPWDAGSKQRLESMRAEVEQARRAHGGDREAQRRAMQASARKRAYGSCGPAIAAAVIMQTPALWSPVHQTIAERVAGIVVVED